MKPIIKLTAIAVSFYNEAAFFYPYSDEIHLFSDDFPENLLFFLVVPLDHDHDGIAGLEVRVLIME